MFFLKTYFKVKISRRTLYRNFCFKHDAATNGEVSQEVKRERRRKRGFDIGPGDLGTNMFMLLSMY